MMHAHEDMDDTGKWGADHPIQALDRAISERRPFIPLGCDQQGRHHPTFVDRMTEQYDMEDQSEGAGFGPWLILAAVVFGAITAAGLAIRWF